jgi:hypothetical protein
MRFEFQVKVSCLNRLETRDAEFVRMMGFDLRF